MGTKVKGLFKGFKHFPNFFEGEEDDEIQIGMPTDVKHVAHIGADGPVAAESPSWMKDFEGGSEESQSGPLEMTKPEGKKGKNHRVSKSEEITRDITDVPKTTKHRRRATDNALDTDSQGKDSPAKTKHTRRHHKARRSQETGDDESTNPKLPDIPKKSRRKKPKDDGESTKPKGNDSSE